MEYIIAIYVVVMLWLLWSIADIILVDLLEKKWKIWPLLKFECICGYTLDVLHAKPSIHLYRLLQVRKHMKSCLPWMFTVDFNGLTPYFGLWYIKDLKNPNPMYASILGPNWLLERHQRYSQRAREGKDPFKDD